jgi:hypothetical protein
VVLKPQGIRAESRQKTLTFSDSMQIPIHRGHLLRFDRGQATDLIAAIIPI